MTLPRHFQQHNYNKEKINKLNNKKYLRNIAVFTPLICPSVSGGKRSNCGDKLIIIYFIRLLTHSLARLQLQVEDLRSDTPLGCIL